MCTEHHQSWKGTQETKCRLLHQQMENRETPQNIYSKLIRPGVIILHIREHLPLCHWDSSLQTI